MPQAIAAAAAWVATAATAVAATVGVSTTMGSALAIYSSVQAVATVALSVGVQVGISALTSPKVGGAGGAGAQVDFQSNPDAGIPYAVGETGTAGVYIYNTVGEAKNRNLLFNSILSLGPIDSFTGFKAADEEVTFGPLQQAVGGTYANRMWQNRQLGLTPSPAFGPPNTTDAGVLAEWTTAHKLSGLAASWYVLGYDQKTYASGAPAPLWKIKGVRAYDPRRDSTYPGGSGSQRWDDEATWAWSDNPWVHALTWCIGRKQNGRRVMGLGCALVGIDVAAFVEAANVADANGWKVSGVVYSTDSKWEVLKALCQAGGGRPIALGAKVSCLVNAPRVSIATLTGADIEGDPTITATQSRRSRVNAVVPRYRSEAHGWDIVPADPLIVDAYVTEDGGQRTQEIEFPLVPDVTQAAQLGAYAITNSREFGPNVIPVTPAKGWALKPGDCITINEPELGMVGQKMLVVERERNLTTGGRILTCVSETDAKHDYCLGRVGSPPPTPGLSGVDPTPEAPASGVWTVAAGPVDSYGSPTLVLTGACDDPNARWINVEYRLAGATTWTAWPGGPPASTRFEITGLAPSASYQVAVSYTSVLNLPGERRVLTAVTTGALPVAPVTPDTTPPAAPSSLSAETSMGSIFLRWTDPSDADLDKIEVWESSWNDRATAIKVATVAGYAAGRNGWTRSGLDSGVTRYYALRARDRSGNVSGWYPTSATGMFAATTDSLAIADFPADLEPVGVFATLPSAAGYTGPKTIRVAADGKLYRYVGGAWVTGVTAADIAGTIADSQVAALSASKVTGALSDSQLAAISAAKVTGQIVATQIADGSIQTPKLAAGSVTAAKIGVGEVVASNIAAGAITSAKIDAGAVTAGKIAAGSISALEIQAGAVTTSKLAAGAVTANEISAGSITGDRLTAGTISSAYIATDAIIANKLAAGAVTASKISAFSITADRLVTGEIDTYYIKSGAISNAGLVDWTGAALLSASSGSPTTISGGITIETRGGGGAYTTIQMTYYFSAVNNDLINQVGLWINLAYTGTFGSGFTGWDSVLVEPGNPGTLTVPIYMRVPGAGYINFAPIAFANVTGGGSQLYATRVKLLPTAIYNS